MKKLLDISLIITLIVYGLMLFLAIGCCTNKQLPSPRVEIKDSIVYKDKEVKVYVPPVIIPGDSVTLHDTIPCPDITYTRKATSTTGKTTVSVSISKGQLEVICKADSIKKLLDSARAVIKEKESYRQETHIEYISVPKWYIPWWCYAVVVVCALIVFICLKK